MKKNIFRGKIGTDKLGVTKAWSDATEEYSDYKYLVLISGDRGIDSPNFSEKTVALRKANEYMKKHDKC